MYGEDGLLLPLVSLLAGRRIGLRMTDLAVVLGSMGTAWVQLFIPPKFKEPLLTFWNKIICCCLQNGDKSNITRFNTLRNGWSGLISQFVGNKCVINIRQKWF